MRKFFTFLCFLLLACSAFANDQPPNVITLLADDIRQIFFPKEADLTFSIINLVCMLIYLIEMVALSLLKVLIYLSKEGYFLKFYFWLDIISTLTMVFDLIWIN